MVKQPSSSFDCTIQDRLDDYEAGDFDDCEFEDDSLKFDSKTISMDDASYYDSTP